MKANHKNLKKLSPTLVFACSAACAVIMAGCLVQPGTTDEQSSQGEALSEGASTGDLRGAAEQPTDEKTGEKTQPRTVLQPNTLHKQGPRLQTLSDGVGDPGGPSQDDDGTEPVPNPWAPHASTAAPAQH
jgi:hypothetical protein